MKVKLLCAGLAVFSSFAAACSLSIVHVCLPGVCSHADEGRALCPAHTLQRVALVLDMQRHQNIYPAFAVLPACHVGACVWHRCSRQLAEGNCTLAEKGGRNLAAFIADAPSQSLEILVCKSSLHSSSHPIYCSPFTHVSKAL